MVKTSYLCNKKDICPQKWWRHITYATKKIYVLKKLETRSRYASYIHYIIINWKIINIISIVYCFLNHQTGLMILKSIIEKKKAWHWYTEEKESIQLFHVYEGNKCSSAGDCVSNVEIEVGLRKFFQFFFVYILYNKNISYTTNALLQTSIKNSEK